MAEMLCGLFLVDRKHETGRYNLSRLIENAARMSDNLFIGIFILRKKVRICL